MNFIYLFFVDVVSKGLGLLALVFCARNLEVSEYGELSIIITALVYAGIFIEFGTTHFGIRDVGHCSLEDRQRIVVNIISIKFTLAFCLVTILVIFFYGTYARSTELLICSIMLLLFGLNEWFFKGMQANGYLLVACLAGSLGYGYLLFGNTTSLQDYFIARFMFVLLTVVLMTFYMLKILQLGRVGFFKHISFSYMLNILKQSWSIFFAAIFVAIYNNSDIIMLGLMKGTYEAGIYDVYYKFVFIFLTFKLLIVTYFFPIFSRLYKTGEMDRLITSINRYGLALFISGLGAVLIVYMNFELILGSVFGEKYLIEDAGVLIFLLLCSVILFFAYAFFPILQIIAHRQKVFLTYACLSAISNVALNLCFIPAYSYIGAAFSTLVTEFILAVFFSYEYYKFCKKHGDQVKG